jgi:hypothetical protein
MVEVNAIYEHLSIKRIYINQGLRMRVKPNVSTQALLTTWIAMVQTSDKVKGGWIQTAKNMRRRSADDEWRILHSGIRMPWHVKDIIYFKHPNRPSTDPEFTSSHARNSGTGAPQGPARPPPAGDGDPSNRDVQNTDAALFTASPPHSSGPVEV